MPTGSFPSGRRALLRAGSPLRLTLPVLGLLFALLAPAASAFDRYSPAVDTANLHLVSTARNAALRSAHSEISTASLRSLIADIRFNQKSLDFENGVTIGPEAGDLEIQFAPVPSGPADSLRYRLLGSDTEWKEADKEGTALYKSLAPGRYEFDFQQADGSGLRGSVVASIPVTVVAPFWRTGIFRNLCIGSLLLLILAIYKLRVRYLLKRNQKLQETVGLTKAELTLAAKIAGDAQEALKEQALKDSLTGLWNRRAIFAMLEREVCRAQRDRFPITLVMIDLDHFKNINDSYGHLTGDEVLREAADRLFEVMRPYDFAGRYGGEEFLVVLPSCSPHNGVLRAEDFRRAIADRPVPTAAGTLAVTCSLGVAAYDSNMPVEDLIHLADEALYRAKRMGRNRVCSANQMPIANRR